MSRPCLIDMDENEAAKWVVNAYDQANTNDAVRRNPNGVQSRNEILHDYVNDLRAELVRIGHPPILPGKNGNPVPD